MTAFNHTLRREDRFLTTEAVLLAFLAAFSGAGAYVRQQAVARVEAMWSHPSIRVIEATRAQLLEGLALDKHCPDKADSLTDCIAMQVMRRAGMTEVLTNDHHFTQEGCRILFPSSPARVCLEFFVPDF